LPCLCHQIAEQKLGNGWGHCYRPCAKAALDDWLKL
jgi:hypothetical protein